MLIPHDGFAVYVEAAVFPDQDLASYGVVIKGNNGNFISVKNGPVRCFNDAHLAEAIAIKEALSWANERGLQKVAIFSDCQIVCNLLNGSSLDFSCAGCVISQWLDLKRHFDLVYIHFIPRSVNKLAYAMTRASPSSTSPTTWFDSIPPCIELLI
ncbi:PREDICTED: uncharacterized protein LOC109172162 [Ipomoea nil]|uniref:uncharacterized protein LOC109172162 n=1 Tax=Ipomoea nil TaxID=35883 RepID=UPI0009014F3D|nr:PREDICTED: uncharacterized protein LOC109172162 [Ipomoea nil]